MDRLRDIRGVRRQVRIGASDPSLTAVAGIVAVTELVSRLRVIESLNSAVGPIKQRNRGHGAGELLVGLAAVQLAGEDFLVGVDRHRADAVGQVLTPVPDLASTTAAGLAHRFTPEQWVAVETGVAAVSQRMLALLPAPRAAVLTEGTVTIDIDATDVEVYGRKKRGVDYNHVGQRCGRPHVASWAEAGTVLAAELLCGKDDPRSYVAALFRRALAALPAAARNGGKVALRADAGYFAGEIARVAHIEGVAFAIGAKRIAPLWELLRGVGEDDWTDAIDMRGAQVAVADYRPEWWPSATSLLIRRVRLAPEQISADLRSRRRRTLHPDQRALPWPELAKASTVYGYSFVNVAAPREAAARNDLPFLRHRARLAPTAVRSAPRTVSPVAGPIPVKGHCSARNHRRSRRTGFRAVSVCSPSRRLLPTRSVICGWGAPTNWPAVTPRPCNTAAPMPRYPKTPAIPSSSYGLGSVNLVKPGVGETTRVLLRRGPRRWRAT